jgi:methyl-accepting chemotaxis protein
LKKSRLLLICIISAALAAGLFLVQVLFRPDLAANAIVFSASGIIIAVSMLFAAWRSRPDNQTTAIAIVNENAARSISTGIPVDTPEDVRESAKGIFEDLPKIQAVVTDIESDTKKQSEWNEGVQAAIETIKYYIDSIYEKMGSHEAVINETAGNLERTVSFIDSVSDLSAEASNQTNELVSITALLNESMSDLFTSIDNIDRTSKLIKNLIAIIEEIAERTNLIAINAAIEAAHVREAGKGFNVISTEIRKLSTNTKSQVKEIEQLIKDILARIEESAEKREEAGINLRTMNTSIDRMKAKMDAMLAESRRQRDLNRQIVEELSSLRTNSEDLKQDITEGYESSEQAITITNNFMETSHKIYGYSKTLSSEICGLFERLERLAGGGNATSHKEDIA